VGADFEIFSKKGISFGFEWEKTNFTTFGSPWKVFVKLPWCPPKEKSFRRP